MDYKAIEKKVKKILSDLNIKKIPVDLVKIAKKYNIKISEAPNDDKLSGLLLKSNGQAIIGVNALHHKNRKRFTIAHELGHFFLHQKEDTFVDEHNNLALLKFRHDSQMQTEEEVEANRFAASLLMPADRLKENFKAVEDVVDELEDLIELLSKKYEVSYEAMKYRLINLDLIKNSPA